MLSPFIFKHQLYYACLSIINIRCNVWKHFCHEDITKNIFIMIVSLTLKCVEVKGGGGEEAY